jgi:hypothetical protein
VRQFYRDNRFHVAGYQDLQKAFEQASGEDLQSTFDQWLNRTGMPLLEISDTAVTRKDDHYVLKLELVQSQNDNAFKLFIPLWIQTDSGNMPLVKNIHMQHKRQEFRIPLDDRPIRIAVDPRFDVLRHLHDSEIPSSLGQLFGADEGLIVLSTLEQPAISKAYRDLASKWSENGKEFSVVTDDEISQLPNDRMIWLLGRHNRFRSQLAMALDKGQFSVSEDVIGIHDVTYAIDKHSFAITSRRDGDNSADNRQTIGWLSAASVDGLPGLARKLPHYGKYSYVVFEGNEPANVLKGQWTLTASALQLTLSGGSAFPPMKLPPQSVLSEVVSP